MKKVILSLCLLPMFALAHVTVESNNESAGEYAKITFRVPHGCEGSATTKIKVMLPEGTLSVKPQVHPGWTITTKTEKLKKPVELHGRTVLETLSEITWAGGPLPDAYMDEFGVSLLLPNKPGEKIFFPVVQECEKGSLSWTDIKDPHGKTPAPYLFLVKKTKPEEHHH